MILIQMIIYLQVSYILLKFIVYLFIFILFILYLLINNLYIILGIKKKQKQISKKYEEDSIYRQIIDRADFIAEAYDELIKNQNIVPFIKILRRFLLSRSKMSLSTANEAVLQAIIENFLPPKCYIPEL